jgi:hypothetical protein
MKDTHPVRSISTGRPYAGQYIQFQPMLNLGTVSFDHGDFGESYAHATAPDSEEV